jgi:lipopolysaccharide export system protein LptC
MTAMAEERQISAAGSGGPPARRTFRYVPLQRRQRLSRWHSRLVSLLKLILPSVALVLVALVVLWPELQNQVLPVSSTAIVQNENGTIRMINPRYFGVDDNDQPFSVVAQSADQIPGDEDLIDLARPEAELTRTDGTWLALNAETGRYDRRTNRIRLSGDVMLFRDDGFAAETSLAHVDLNQRTAWGDQPIVVHGPTGEIEAEGFRIADEGATIIFTGRSRLLIRGAGGSESSE